MPEYERFYHELDDYDYTNPEGDQAAEWLECRRNAGDAT